MMRFFYIALAVFAITSCPAAQNIQNLAPEPFAGVTASGIFAVISAAPIGSNFIDAFFLGGGSMIFPQNKHGIGIIAEFFIQSQNFTIFADNTRRGTGGIYCQTADTGFILTLHDLRYTLGQTFQIIQRMLPVRVGCRIAIQTLSPAAVI